MKNIILSLGLILFGQLLFGQASNEKMPVFQNEDNNLMLFIQKNTTYPTVARDNCITGTVVMSFIIDKSGKLDSIKVINSINKLLDQEAIRLIKLTDSKWSPATKNDTATSIKMTCPIKFSLKNAGCKDANYFYNEGVNYSNEKKYEKAVESFDISIKLDPYNIDALYNCAIMKFKLNDPLSACVYLKKIKDIGKPDADELLNKYCK